nr:hypothetical protein [uncultured Flavobacterium sp.]
MSINIPIVGNATAKDTVYTMVPSNASLLPKLLTIGITGPIIFQQFALNKKFNITQKPKNAELQRMTDGNFITYQSPSRNLGIVEVSFSPASPTVQTLSNLATLQESIGNIVFSLNVTNPSSITTTQYPIFILLSSFGGYEENERVEDVTFEFGFAPSSLVNIGALANAIGNLI